MSNRFASSGCAASKGGRGVVVVFALGVGMLLGTGCQRSAEPKAPSGGAEQPQPGGGEKPAGGTLAAPKADFSVTAEELAAEFKKDRAATEAKYKGKTLEVSGTINRWGWNETTVLFLKVAGEPESLISCVTKRPDPWKEAAPGQKVKVRGKWVEYMWPALEDFVFVETGPFRAVVVSAEQLAQEALKDAAAMGKKYEGKYLVVEGEIIGTKADRTGTEFVLKGKDAFAVEFGFTSFENGLVGGFKPGDRLKVLGLFGGVREEGVITLYTCMPFMTESSKPGSATKPPSLTLEALKKLRKAREESRENAVALLKKAGVNVREAGPGALTVELRGEQFTPTGDIKPDIRKALAEAHRVEELDLYDTPVTDGGLAGLKSLPRLERLILPRAKITDAGLAHLEGLPRLQSLVVSDIGDAKVSIGDAGLKHLQGLADLITLRLQNAMVTDKGLAYLKGMPKLQFLYLSRNPITGPGLEHLQSLTKLERLALLECPLSDEGLQYLKACPNLTDLDLTRTKISDEGLKRLAGAPELATLDISGTGVTDAGLQTLSEVNALTSLTVMECPRVTPGGIAQLKKALPKLKVER